MQTLIAKASWKEATEPCQHSPMVNLQDVVPWSLIWGAQNRRHAAEMGALRAQLRHVRLRFLTGMICLCDGGPPESTQAMEFLDWPSGFVPNHLRDLRYNHTDVVEALLDAIIVKLYDYDPFPQGARTPMLKCLKKHLKAPHTPERVALELKGLCLKLDIHWWSEDDTTKIQWMAWAAHVFLRTLSGTCPPVCPRPMGTGLRFTDHYFKDQ